MNKRIVIFSAFYEPHLGGVERYVKELSFALQENDTEIIIVTSDTDNIGFFENNNSIDIFRLKHSFFIDGRLPLPKSLSELKKTEEIILKFNPDIIILNMRIYPLMLFGAYLAKKNSIPLILIDHVSGYFHFDSFIKSKLSIFYEKVFTYYLKKRVDSFYGVSEKVNSWLKNFGIESKGIIYNGVNENPEYNPNFNIETFNIIKSKFTIIFAGRLIEEKGINVLCKAYEKFRNHDTQLIVCGDGPLLEQLKKENTNEDIIFTGKISHKDVISLLKMSDVAVIPSFYPEGLPTIILEAGISHCAVLTTDSGGAKEVIINNYNGTIIEKKSEDSIADNLEILYNDRSRLNNYSENLHNTVKDKFTWRIIADSLINEIKIIRK
jgi:glycosyltransferase involved in cell wall biosynthesis